MRGEEGKGETGASRRQRSREEVSRRRMRWGMAWKKRRRKTFVARCSRYRSRVYVSQGDAEEGRSSDISVGGKKGGGNSENTCGRGRGIEKRGRRSV